MAGFWFLGLSFDCLFCCFPGVCLTCILTFPGVGIIRHFLVLWFTLGELWVDVLGWPDCWSLGFLILELSDFGTDFEQLMIFGLFDSGCCSWIFVCFRVLHFEVWLG